MPDQFSPEIRRDFKEEDIERVSREIERGRELPESKGVGEREILRKVVQSVTGSTGTQKKAVSDDDSVLPDYVKSAPPGVKLEVETLLEAVFSKGLEEAAKEAKKSSPFVLDAFHDALVGKLYDELQKRGIVK